MTEIPAWLPGYEHQPIGAGLNWTPGTAWKVGVHSTETGPAPGLIDHWRNNPGAGLPHFLGITPDRIVQLLPLTVGAYTAQNPPGGIDTNRAHLIQIEVCGYAINTRPSPGNTTPRPDWSPDWYEALARWLADLVAAGVPLDLATELTFANQWVGFPGTGADYERFAGVLGHQHIPEQPDRHWDPGQLDIRRLLARARTLANQEDDDMPLNDDDLAKIDQRLGKLLMEQDAREKVYLDAILDQLDPRRQPGQPVTPLRDLVEALALGGGTDAGVIADRLLAFLPAETARAVTDALAAKLAG